MFGTDGLKYGLKSSLYSVYNFKILMTKMIKILFKTLNFQSLNDSMEGSTNALPTGETWCAKKFQILNTLKPIPLALPNRSSSPTLFQQELRIKESLERMNLNKPLYEINFRVSEHSESMAY